MSTCTASECYREPTGSGKARLAAIPAAEEEKAGKAEGKIKEAGSLSGRFLGKPLSAHCFGARRTAPCFWVSRAAIWRKALALQGFDRHSNRISADFPPSRLRMRR